MVLNILSNYEKGSENIYNKGKKGQVLCTEQGLTRGNKVRMGER